jgi:catechol 2,3-dioxygenase-like lactoylglutathione lyase family enzyme
LRTIIIGTGIESPLRMLSFCATDQTRIQKKEYSMRASIGFVIGVLFGLGVASAVAQNNRLDGVNNMNHVGIAVERFDEALAFYTQKMGFREAFTIRDEKGQPTLSYVQVSRDTFVELQPANANRPPGLTHFGLHVQDLAATAATLKQRGVTIEEPRAGRPDSMVANATGPGGIRIEIFQFGPESLQGKAINSWK